MPDDERGAALLDAARRAIAEMLGVAAPEPAEPAADLRAAGSSFVTLTTGGRLRGCIGTLSFDRPLIEDVRANARAAAEREGVDVRTYRIIYEAVEDVRAALEGLLKPEEREVVLGEAEVRETFKVPRIGLIAGCSVRSGVINRQGRARVIRDGIEIYDGNIASLRRFKDDVREVREGFECGIGIENFNDIKVGDVIECYRKEQVARTLASTASA